MDRRQAKTIHAQATANGLRVLDKGLVWLRLLLLLLSQLDTAWQTLVVRVKDVTMRSGQA